jgi:hypothetical protein
LTCIQDEAFLGGKLIRRLSEDMVEERSGCLQRLDVEEVLKVYDTTRVGPAKSGFNGKPTVLVGLAHIHLTAAVLLGHHIHVHGEILLTEQVLELHRLSIREFMAYLEALLVYVVIILL